MSNYKRAPEDDLPTHVEDLTPVPRHEFTEANDLDLFTFDENGMSRWVHCPDDCGAFCEPGNLGEAVDWALSHRCGPEWAVAGTTAPTAAREKD